jgi:hypothetical protein
MFKRLQIDRVANKKSTRGFFATEENDKYQGNRLKSRDPTFEREC